MRFLSQDQVAMLRAFVTAGIGLLLFSWIASAREWSDASGKFSVEAEFVDVKGADVVLRKPDGTTITVKIERLCAADREHLKSLASKRQSGKPLTWMELDKRMGQKIKTDVRERPVGDLDDVISQALGVPVVVRAKDLSDQSIDPKKPLEINSLDQTLTEFLAEMNRRCRLRWSYVDGLFRVGTTKDAIHAVVYESRLSKPRGASQRGSDALLSDLREEIKDGGAGSWDDTGGEGSIEIFDGKLVIAQDGATHQWIRKTFADRLQASEVQPKWMVTSPQHDWLKIAAALKRTGSLECVGKPLKETFLEFGRRLNVPVRIDEAALTRSGVSPDAAITLSIENVANGTILEELLKTMYLDYYFEGGGIVVTTVKEAERKAVVVEYSKSRVAAIEGSDGGQLQDLIATIIRPASWDAVGGFATVDVTPKGTVEVRHTAACQWEIAQLLETLERDRQVR